TVRPRFHLARADAGTHAHLGARPLHSPRRIEACVVVSDLMRELMPALQQLAARASTQPDARVVGHRVTSGERIDNAVPEPGEGVRPFEREARCVIEQVQVAEHVVEGPALELGRLRLAHWIDVGEQRVESVALVAIVDGLGQHREYPVAEWHSSRESGRSPTYSPTTTLSSTLQVGL